MNTFHVRRNYEPPVQILRWFPRWVNSKVRVFSYISPLINVPLKSQNVTAKPGTKTKMHAKQEDGDGFSELDEGADMDGGAGDGAGGGGGGLVGIIGSLSGVS